MALQHYVKRLRAALAGEDGDQLQQCLSVNPDIIPGGQRILATDFTEADVEEACSGGGLGPPAPVVRTLAKEMLLYMLSFRAGDAQKASLHLRGAYRIFVEDNSLLGGRGGQSGWLLPTLESMSRDVRTLVKETAGTDEDVQADVTGMLHMAFSQCLRDRTPDLEESKKSMAMHMAVVLYKHCFRINSLQTVKSISSYVNGGAQRLPCNSGDSVASLYFEGLMLMRSAVGSKYNHKAMQLSRAGAERVLAQALKECHKDAIGNRKRILANLVPIRMRMGCLPERALLEKYDLVIFDDFSQAIRRGDLRRFSTLMKRHKHTLELNDLRVHMEDCRLLVYRQVLKKIVAGVGRSAIPLTVVRLGFVLRGHEFDTGCEPFGLDSGDSGVGIGAESQPEYEDDQLKGILAILIDQGMIKGLIQGVEGVLWLKVGDSAFPDLPGRSDRVTRTSARLLTKNARSSPR